MIIPKPILKTGGKGSLIYIIICDIKYWNKMGQHDLHLYRVLYFKETHRIHHATCTFKEDIVLVYKMHSKKDSFQVRNGTSEDCVAYIKPM